MAPPISSVASTPILGQFLVAINGFVKERNEAQLTDYVVIEPPYSDMYNRMIAELRQHYPKGAEDALENKCSQALPSTAGGEYPSWSMFVRFMAQYLSFIRDVDMDQSKYLETYELLTELQKKANSALRHGQLGYLVLGIVVSCAKALCRLAIGLDKHPELIAHVKNAGADDDESKGSLPERAAEIIRVGMVECMNDRLSTYKDGKIEGKKRGTYLLANICFKIFFTTRKTRNVSTILGGIGQSNMPLSSYPKRERVTYLYYLGRFWFQNSHFQRARLALQQSYDECSAAQHSIRQRRHILVFLIASNIIVGRLPTEAIFQRPEAHGLQERFLPIMHAIRTGNVALFRQHMSFESLHADWFLHFRIFLQLRNRCEVLVWRSLVRKVWVLNGTRYVEGSKTAITFDIDDLVTVFTALERQSTTPEDQAYTDPDFEGEDMDYEPSEEEKKKSQIRQVESVLSSLVDQGFLRGFIAHPRKKFSIIGVTRTGGDVLAAGFPQPWRVIEQNMEKEGTKELVPGWNKGAPGLLATGGAGGNVIRMSNLKEVGLA